MRKLFAVGDIHGCLSNLKKLLAGIEIDYERDSIYFLGDYIDRGPDSRSVIDFIIDLKRGCDNVFCLSGKNTDNSPNFLIPSNDRIQTALAGQLGVVLGIALQRLVLLLRTLVGDCLAAADVLARGGGALRHTRDPQSSQ